MKGQLIRENNKALDKTFIYGYNEIVNGLNLYTYAGNNPLSLAGAKLGASLGSAAGPVGFAIGAVVGAAAGWVIDEFGDVIIDWVVGWFD